MGTRSFEIEDFTVAEHVVKFDDALMDMIDLSCIDLIDIWLEPRTNGKYLILPTTVRFTDERDALIFKLGYNHDNYFK